MKKQQRVKTKYGTGEIVGVENPSTKNEIIKVFVQCSGTVLSFRRNEIEYVKE